MRRAAFAAVALISTLAVQAAMGTSFASSGRKAFVDPARGLSIPVPKGWTPSPGFGETIAVFKGDSDSSVRVMGPLGGGRISDSEIGGYIRMAHPDADFKKGGAGRHAIFTAGRDAKRKGVAIRGGSGGCAFVAVCEGDESNFAETFLGCRDVVRGAACDSGFSGECRSSAVGLGEIPTPQRIGGSKKAGVARAALMKGVYALLDGRGSCRGVRDELASMSNIVRSRGCAEMAGAFDELSRLLSRPGDPSRLKRFAHRTGGNLKEILEAIALEGDGHGIAAARIYERLAKGGDGFFAGLRLAKLRMDADDVDSALKALARIKGKGAVGSNLMVALELRLARIYGDQASAESVFGSFDGEMCGESGALAAYEMGLMVGRGDPKGALKYFEVAIGADPGFVPSYPALGRALVEGGMSAGGATEILRKQLNRAPGTREIEEMRGRLAEYLAKLSGGPG